MTTTCPHCGKRNDRHTCASEPGAGPAPGDVSVCIDCGEPSRFGPQLDLVVMEAADRREILADPKVQRVRDLIGVGRLPSASEYRAYARQGEQMVAELRAWLAANPGRAPRIQYNFTAQVAVIGTVCDALAKHFISLNDDARAMLDALGWSADVSGAPTVLMLRMAMERALSNTGPTHTRS